jgi:hypothetical protein
MPCGGDYVNAVYSRVADPTPLDFIPSLNDYPEAKIDYIDGDKTVKATLKSDDVRLIKGAPGLR